MEGEKHIGGEYKNPLKSEHLMEGVSPIMTCYGLPKDFKGQMGIEKEAFLGRPENSPRTVDIDYFADPEELWDRNIRNAGSNSYMISGVDDLNKFSSEFKNCTGLVVVGRDRRTGKNISFMSHQNPMYFLDFKEGEDLGHGATDFLKDLSIRLENLKHHAMEGTVDAVIVGGNYFNDGLKNADLYRDNYKRSIKFVSKLVSETFGFEPVVVAGPKTNRATGGAIDNVFFDDENRRLYLLRSNADKDVSPESFLAKDVEDQEKKW
jgi:hypothetical protein